ncbi:MAG: hypothetical protein Q9173_006519 [Seirophora scorigena]
MSHETPASYDLQTNSSQSCPRFCPLVTEWRPNNGSQGTQLYIFIKSQDDLKDPSYPTIALMFATRQCAAILTRVESYSTSYDFVLTADAPSLSSTGWQASDVPVSLHFQAQSGASAGMIEMGFFSYTGHQRSFLSSPRSVLSRDDLLTDSNLSNAASRLAVSQQLLPGAYDTHPSECYGTRSPSSHSVSRAIPHNTSAPRFSPYEAARDNYRRRSSTFSGSSVSSCLAQTPSVPRWSSEYAATNDSGKSSVSTGVASATRSSFIATTATATPLLYRKSELSKKDCPYRDWLKGPNATLHIYGDPESMARHWTPAEQASKRRLVQFWRTQTGTSVNTGFEPVVAEERSPNTLCVSCIWWEERAECFLTSVDTLRLLALVAGNDLDTNEHNRIRRNVENMHPTTIGKPGKPKREGEEEEEEEEIEDLFEIEKFFELVMGFNNPRPRHINKRLKVFPWRLLGPMLMKIMGKYVSHPRRYASIRRQKITGLGVIQCAIYPPTTDTAGGLRPSVERRMYMKGMMTKPDGKRGVPSHAYGPKSQPIHLSPNLNSSKTETDPSSPCSTSNSTSSSVYSGGSRQSSTASPITSHGLPTVATMAQPAFQYSDVVGSSHSPNPVPSIFSNRVKYSGMQYPYPATAATQQDPGMQYHHPYATTASELLSPKLQQQAPVVRSRRGALDYGSSRYDSTDAVAGEDERKPRVPPS